MPMQELEDRVATNEKNIFNLSTSISKIQGKMNVLLGLVGILVTIFLFTLNNNNKTNVAIAEMRVTLDHNTEDIEKNNQILMKAFKELDDNFDTLKLRINRRGISPQSVNNGE